MRSPVRCAPVFSLRRARFELDIQCLICGGSGCAVCKQERLVELLPCGLVNPMCCDERHRSGEWNASPSVWGLRRLVMMRMAIDDIRQLQGGICAFWSSFEILI